MDAKAKTTETASAAEAITEKKEDGADTKAGNAVRTIEERLEAGLKAVGMGEEGPDPEESTPEATPEEGKPPAEKPEEGEDGEIADGEVEGLSAKAQAKINARIHEINIKRKNAEAKSEQAEAQLKVLGSKVQDENVQAVMKLGLDPEYITADEAKTLNRFENLRAWKKWLRTHRDGYEGAGTKEDPSMTSADVAEREAAIEDELLDVAGPARTLWLERSKQMREDMALGRKTRLAEAAKRDAPAKKLDPKPPKLPETNTATRRPPVSAGSKGKAVFDKKEFNEAGADGSALEKQYEKLFGN
ncbi:MAG: hypothetical protein WCK89_22625 [bacterium]